MDLIIELESEKAGLLSLMPENTALPCLDMAPAGPGKPSRIPVTSEQFRALARDIEGHACGKFGVPRDLQLWARNADTGETERITYEQAKQIVDLNMAADAKAAELQARQAARVQAAEAERLAAKQQAQAEAAQGGLAGGVALAVTELQETLLPVNPAPGAQPTT